MSQTIELDLTYEPYKNAVIRHTKYLGKEQIISPAEDVNEYKKRTTQTLFNKIINILNKLYNDINKNEPFLYKTELEDVFSGGYDPPGYNRVSYEPYKPPPKQLVTRYKINLNNKYIIKSNEINEQTCKNTLILFEALSDKYEKDNTTNDFKTIESLHKNIHKIITSNYGTITSHCGIMPSINIFYIIHNLNTWLKNLLEINYPQIYKCKKYKNDQQQYIIGYNKDIETFNIKKKELITLHQKINETRSQIEKQIHELQDQYNKDGCATIRGGKRPLRNRHVQTRRYIKKRQQTVKRRRRQN